MHLSIGGAHNNCSLLNKIHIANSHSLHLAVVVCDSRQARKVRVQRVRFHVKTSSRSVGCRAGDTPTCSSGQVDLYLDLLLNGWCWPRWWTPKMNVGINNILLLLYGKCADDNDKFVLCRYCIQSLPYQAIFFKHLQFIPNLAKSLDA